MFKLVVIAGFIGLLAACSSMSGSTNTSRSMDASNPAAMGAARSPGEGPAFNPYYGAAGS